MKNQSEDFILKNIHLIDPLSNIDGPSELWIENGLIKDIGKPGSFSSKPKSEIPEIVDGGGHHCFPGFVDVHTHLREPGFEYKETIQSGTKAAAAGGFTTVLCMANTNPVNDNPYVTEFILAQARTHGHVRVLPVGALSQGLKGEQLAEIGKMVDAGIVAVSDDGMTVMNSYLMRKALDYCKAFEIPIISHAEDTNLVGHGVMNEGFHSNCLGLRGIPAESEEIIIARDVALARLTKGRLHFAHVSAKQSLFHIKRAKEEGLSVTAEVTPHHLMFTDKDVQSYNTNFKMAPPLRGPEHVAHLKQAIKDGIIDCIATDHAPHAPRDKSVLFEFAANGVVGLETSFSVGLDLVDQGIITLKKCLELVTVNPAKIFGINAGCLKQGTPADFTLVDLKAQYEIQPNNLNSKSKNSPFIGKKVRGRVLRTYVGGCLKWDFELNS